MIELLKIGLDFLKDILPCPNLKTFKLYCYRALLGALVIDVGISVYVNWPNISFQLAGSDLVIVITMAILLVFLVMIDVIIDDRRRRFALHFRNVLSDPNVPEDVKRIIAKELLGN